MTIIGAFAVINLPKKYPEEYKKAYIRIPRPWLIVFAILTAVTSLPFIVGVIVSYHNAALMCCLLIGLNRPLYHLLLPEGKVAEETGRRLG